VWKTLAIWCVRSRRRGRCAFADGCIRVRHGNITFNHRESHLPCGTNIIIDVCINCHPDLPRHVLRRIQGLRKISPPNRTPNICNIIGYGSNAHNILNICINCPKYKPCEKEMYDLLFYIAYKCCDLIDQKCLNNVGKRNIHDLERKFKSTNCRDLIENLCHLLTT